MIYKWETQEERLRRFIAIAPKKKLEWLFQMHYLLVKAFTKKKRNIYYKLRQSR